MSDYSWYSKYYNINSMIVINDVKYNNLIEILKTQNNKHSIYDKVAQNEADFNIRIKELQNLYENNESIEMIKKMNSLQILQKELDIIKLLTKYSLQNKQLDYTFFLNVLTLLLTLSETLRIRLGQKEISFGKKNHNDNISRCSYKFCNFKDSCSYNYNKNKNMCYQDHYVHNMVSLDLKVLIEYIKLKFENLSDNKELILLYNKEILKTINTLSFVITHMENELKSKCLYLPEKEIESCHVVKTK